MCGVFGLTSIAGDHPQRAQFSLDIQTATQRLTHRGPDDQGWWISPSGRLGLGHTRLSIVDLSSRARQPMVHRQNHALTYNGEIYNYKTLRQHLRPYAYTTESDSEVLLVGLAEHGPRFLPQLDGMFAFGFYDANEDTLLLACDPTGKKPLYTYWDGQTFAFASEIKSFLTLPQLRLEVDAEALKSSLFYGYVPAPRTMYANVRKLPAGHYQVIDLATGPQSPVCYWDIPLGQQKSERSYPEAQIELRYLLSEAVKKRLVADVEVGCFLSGGVDSSSVAFEASRLLPVGELKTFAAGFSDDVLAQYYDESPFASRVAKRIGSNHVEFQVSTEINEAAEIASHFDEPFGDSSCIPTHYLCKETRKHVKVALSGDGGDELFGGYLRFRAALLSETGLPLWKLLLAPLPKASMAPHQPLLARLSRYRSALGKPLLERLACWNAFFSEEDFALFAERSYEQIRAQIQQFDDRTQGVPVGEKALYYNFKTYLFDDLLPKVDRMSMYNGLEVRCPFLDKALIQFAFELPTSFKFDILRTKRVLKDAYTPVLGRDITHRPKHGFAFPLESFLGHFSHVASGRHLRKVIPHWSSRVKIDSTAKRFLLWQVDNLLSRNEGAPFSSPTTHNWPKI